MGTKAGRDRPDDNGGRNGPDQPDQRQADNDAGQDALEDRGDKKADDPKRGNGDDGAQDERGRVAVWPWLAGGGILCVFVAVVLFEVFSPKPDVWTDDAYVTAHYTTISPRVSGRVIAVPANDNQAVADGQLLVRLDPHDYETAVAQAEGALVRDAAQVANSAADVTRQPAIIVEEEAAVARIKARLGFALQDQARYRNLASTGAGTKQQNQQADAMVAELRAQLTAAGAAVDASKQQLQVLKTQVSRAEGTVEVDRAQLRQARLNLGYTDVLAPLDGLVGNRMVQVGDYVTPGMAMMTVVPLMQAFITANYRELALRHMRIGQPVTIHVDAYNIDLVGVVNSLPPASDAVYAPIAPENATGNFTKIVQRLPVKIVVSADQPLFNLLKLGFSVETTVHTGLADVVAQQRAHPDALITR